MWLCACSLPCSCGVSLSVSECQLPDRKLRRRGGESLTGRFSFARRGKISSSIKRPWFHLRVRAGREVELLNNLRVRFSPTDHPITFAFVPGQENRRRQNEKIGNGNQKSEHVPCVVYRQFSSPEREFQIQVYDIRNTGSTSKWTGMNGSNRSKHPRNRNSFAGFANAQGNKISWMMSLRADTSRKNVIIYKNMCIDWYWGTSEKPVGITF